MSSLSHWTLRVSVPYLYLLLMMFVSGAMLTNIINNIWKEGTLTLKVQWDNVDTTWDTL